MSKQDSAVTALVSTVFSPTISKTIAVAMVFLCVNTTAWSDEKVANTDSNSSPSSNVYLSLADQNNAPLTEAREHFDCNDKIFTVVELDNYAKGKHHFSVRWLDPNGDLREHTQYSFHVKGVPQNRLWAWLLLSRAQGAGMISWINPAAGLEEFIGEWKIEVRIDDKLINSQDFEVSC